jgi:hypothetical protein
MGGAVEAGAGIKPRACAVAWAWGWRADTEGGGPPPPAAGGKCGGNCRGGGKALELLTSGWAGTA